MVPSRLRGPRRGAGPPRALFGQEREGPPRVLRVLADRAPYRNPNGAGKASQVRSALPGAASHPAFTRRAGAATYLTSSVFRPTLLSAARDAAAGDGCRRERVRPGASISWVSAARTRAGPHVVGRNTIVDTDL